MTTVSTNPALLAPLDLLPPDPVDGQTYRLPGISAAVALRGNVGRLITLGEATGRGVGGSVLNIRRHHGRVEVQIGQQWFMLERRDVQLALKSLHAVALSAPPLRGEHELAPLLTPAYHDPAGRGEGWWLTAVCAQDHWAGRVRTVTVDLRVTQSGESFPARRVLTFFPEPPHSPARYEAHTPEHQRVLDALGLP
ncbi:hypothetical protein LAJ19_20300 (plasmid) [Deinococcus taeanensis]|uniref:hypothetical protein n=1 Tax=Deinococcus taeanensis TaxID=2737050 RepID=UPI001CDD0A62|nr:hypothetical protein [Deinococcus taeanensis]UBV45469.1 hypothetical protein LAJ19_20300 [Deinococcus taeanensis]